MAAQQSTPDLLSDVLSRLRVSMTALGIFSLSEPWGYSVPNLSASLLYLVAEGQALIELDGLAPFSASPGDIILVRESTPHIVRSSVGVPTPSFVTLVPEGVETWAPGKPRVGPTIFRAGGGGANTKLLTALVGFAEDDNYLLRLNLPHLVSIGRPLGGSSSWRQAAIEEIASDAHRGQGYYALAARLGELLCLDVIRHHLIDSGSRVSGWLRAAGDPRLARALSAIHRSPERHWTVAELAHEAGMSRSSFTLHFGEQVGESPLAYLTRWRMSLARDWIADGHMSIKQVAERMGYASDKALSQAFRREFGRPPSAFRPEKGGDAAIMAELPPR